MGEFAQELFQDISVWDFLRATVDIFIVYYLIYRVLLTIKGTRAAQMVIGIVGIGSFFFVAERFELATVAWLLDGFIRYFIIIVIVIFQQDIRRALMRLGQNLSSWGRTHEISHALDEVISAAEQMARARIGGIVVFEREASLTDFVEHGEIVDARVSKELLISLFVPARDNVLHDGAILIKDWRIERAGTVLPLSHGVMAHDLGTRHRAGVGITEETDAVALVISEERGEVSLCFGGNIARDLEGETLRSALHSLFGRDEDAETVAKEAQAAADIAKAVAALAGPQLDSSDTMKIEKQKGGARPPTEGRAKTDGGPKPKSKSGETLLPRVRPQGEGQS
jgi:uncharacterized protein (TIGR00159 family)